MNLTTLADAKKIIEATDEFSVSDSFDLSKFCLSLLKNKEKEHLGRELVIRVLDNSRKFPKATYELWNDIVEMSGLYPYVNSEILDESALLRYEFHKSSHLESIYFHEEQQEVSFQLAEGRSVILSAPTSFGKSLLIEEIIASKRHQNVVIIQPTLALLDETRKKLSKYRNTYNLVVSTSQFPNEKAGNIFLFTGERVVEYQRFPEITFFVIDELYKLSLDRDDDRAITLNQAFHKLLKQTKNFYLLSPVIKSIPISFQEKLDIGIRYTRFSTVAVDEISVISDAKENADEKKQRLFNLLKELDEPTLIYCSAPEKATEIADEFANNFAEEDKYLDQNIDLIEWIDENINDKWCLINCLGKGIAFHNGVLPRHLGSSIVDAFNNGGIKYLFCTSTLIEGVNTTAKNIVLFDNTKGNRIPIDFFDYKNIAGRSGRMNIHFTGRIFRFYETPPLLELEVDIPFVTQLNAPAELLTQLDKDELLPESREKLKKYDEVDKNLIEIIKSNSGLTIEGQLAVVNEIERNIQVFNRLISWSGFPKYPQLLPVIDLAWRHLLKKNESKAYVRSAKQLTTYAIQYSIYKNIKAVIDNQINQQFWLEQLPDEKERINKVTFRMLNATRHWFDYKLPKLLTTISKLQEYVFNKHEMRYGDYSAFASAIESGFVDSPLTILLEYDVPMSAITKLESLFNKGENSDSVFGKLKGINLDETKLSNYEKHKIKQAL